MKRLVFLAVAGVVALICPNLTLADGPHEETINLSAISHVASLSLPSGSGSAGISATQMSSFQSAGTTPIANVIDNGLITTPPPPTLGAKTFGLHNSDNSAAGLLTTVAPDPQIAVGPNHIVEMVEVVGRIYDKNNLAPAANFELGDLFGLPTPRCADGAAAPCWTEGNPRLMYDDLSDRFIATYTSYIDYPSGADSSRLYTAISQTSDPTGSWNIYSHAHNDVYADEPWVGVTSDKITISFNLVDIDTFGFVGQKTYVYNKTEALAGGPFTNTVFPIDPSFFSIRPAQHMTPGSDQFAATIEGNTLKVIRYTGVPGISGITRTITSVPISGHVAPILATDPGGGFIDTGDGRLLDAFVDGNSLWVTTNTFCQLPPLAYETCAQLIQVNLTTNTAVQNIVYGFAGQDNYYPAARTDSNGNLVAVFNRSDSGGINVGAWAVARASSDAPNTLSASTFLQPGEISVTSDQTPGSPPARWGSYYATARDPSAPCVWAVGQYALDVPGVSGGNDWGTSIAKLAHPSVANQCADDFDDDGLYNVSDGDDDSDGYDDVAEDGAPLCLAATNDDNTDDPLVNDGCPANAISETACTNTTDDDNDGFTNDGCAQQGSFSEGQFKIGTGALAPCHEGIEAGPSPSWPSDLVSDPATGSTDKVTLTDLTSFLASPRPYDTSPGTAAFNSRWDLVPGRGTYLTWINLQDITALIAPGSPTGAPPMFGGVRAFGGPACSGP